MGVGLFDYTCETSLLHYFTSNSDPLGNGTCAVSGTGYECYPKPYLERLAVTYGLALWVDAVDTTDATCVRELNNVLPASLNYPDLQALSPDKTASLYYDGDDDGYASSMCCVFFGTNAFNYAEIGTLFTPPSTSATGLVRDRGDTHPLHLKMDPDATHPVGARVVPSTLLSVSEYDCDDASIQVSPAVAEDQLAYVNDGIDQNCDGKDACLADADDDNYPASPPSLAVSGGGGDPRAPMLGNCLALPNLAPNAPADGGGTANPSDCNDGEAIIHPNPPRTQTGSSGNNPSVEIAGNTVDEDCNRFILCALDADGDGFGSATQTKSLAVPAACGAPGTGTSANALDCNDAAPLINPSAAEIVGDGLDQNCDYADKCYADADEDGWGDPTAANQGTPPRAGGSPTALITCDSASPDWKWSSVGGDCSDSDPAIHRNENFDGTYRQTPADAAVDVAGDAIDQDCDGSLICFGDADGDGFGKTGTTGTVLASGGKTCANQGSAGHVSSRGDDCDDAAPLVYPGATELVGDGVDQSCDYADACYKDLDEDGWGDPAVASGTPARPGGTPATTLIRCDSADQGWKWSSVVGDCADSDPAIHQNTSFDGTYRQDPRDRVLDLAGDAIDQDCDGSLTCFLDADGDGFGVTGTAAFVLQTGANTCANQDVTAKVAKYGGDCNDLVANDGIHMHPNAVGGIPVAGTVRNGAVLYGTAVETAGDNLDQDCEGKDLCFADKDNDNYGVNASVTASVVPSAAPSVAGWNTDGSLQVPYCKDTANASDNALDCNDLAVGGSTIHPNTNRAVPGYPSARVSEVAGDNLDQDCDGRDLCFEDQDNDNFGSLAVGAISGPVDVTGNDGIFLTLYCVAQPSAASNSGDCDDLIGQIYPGAQEAPGDDIDQNCNGGDLCYVDADGDHYGGTNGLGVSATVGFTGPVGVTPGWTLDGTVYANDRCDTKPGYSNYAGDCNDTQGDPTSASIHPNTFPDATYRTTVAVEAVGDKVDQDCDGGDSCYADADGDNWGVTISVVAADMPLQANPAYPAVFTLAGHRINGVPISANNPLLLDCVKVDGAAPYPGDCNDDASPLDVDSRGPGWYFHPNTTSAGVSPGATAGFTPAVEAIADDKDHDCDGRDLCYADVDNDNYGVSVATTPAVVPNGTTDPRGALLPDFCARATNAAPNVEDCVDAGVPLDGAGHGPGWYIHPNTHVGAYYLTSVELIGDDKDQDCDFADSCYVDADDDNYGVTANANGAAAPTFTLATTLGLADKLHCVGAPYAAKVATGADLDCDDGDSKSHPNSQVGPGYTPSVEVVADRVDQNCDYNDDCWDDADNDGFGTTRQIALTDGVLANPIPFTCTEERYASATSDDCDDVNPYIFPGAPESVGDVIDEDCNLKLDCYFDGDDDGFGDPNHAVVPDAIATLGPDGKTPLTCDEPSVAHISANKLDCDDADPARNPGKDTPDVPGDAIDQNCDGYLDCFTDLDNDGHGDDDHAALVGGNVVVKAVVATTSASCDQSATDHFAPAADDCYDNDAKRFPGSGLLCGSTTTPCEVCEPGRPQLDDDCDGSVNTATIPATPTVTEHTVPVTTTGGGWIAAYLDADGDGFGSNDARLYTPACEIMPGTSSNNLDCDDAPAPIVGAEGHAAGWFIHPGVFEKCDGVDQNCNGVADEAEAIDPDPANQSTAGCLVMYRDRDRDGTGDPIVSHCVCPDPRQPAEPYVAVSDTDAGDTDWFDQSVDVSPLHGAYAGEDYVAPSTDCDDAHADVRPDDCHDGLDNDGDGWIDAADDGCKVGIGTDANGFGVRSASETNRAATFRRNPAAVRAVVERVDGHDNDCNGEIPAIELDCDDDGSFPLLAVNPPPETFVHAADVGLTSCTEDAGPPSFLCWDEKLELSCDGYSGLWVTRYGVSADGFGGRYSGGYRETLGTSACAALGDCDDRCANRCPGRAETCDGVDNNCSLVQDMSIPLAVSLPSALSGMPLTGTVVAAELDFDGDGHAACTDSFLDGDAEIHLAPLTCSAFTEETKLSDCDDLCFYENSDAVEVCDGFVNVCGASPSEREGDDRDGDDRVSCGAYGPADGLVDEDVFVPVWVDCSGGSVAGTALEGVCPSPAPTPAVPSLTQGPRLIPLIAPRLRAAACDAPLTEALVGLAARAGIADPQDWLEGKESRALVRALCGPDAQTGGLCSTVKVSLLRDEDMLADGEGGSLEPACAEAPEQASVRTVWPSARIVEARQGVVEEECNRLFGKACSEVGVGTPRLARGAPPVVDAQLGVQVATDTDEAGATRSAWWLELGRFAPQTAAGAVMTCWGDPRIEAVRTQTGGDCDDSTADASRDLPEGPNDLVLAYNGLNGDCGRCVDGLDNNCDGLADCADPTCAVCFVGQGQGCAGGRDACGDVVAGGGCTTGTDSRNLAVLGLLPLLGLVARRRARRATVVAGE